MGNSNLQVKKSQLQYLQVLPRVQEKRVLERPLNSDTSKRGTSLGNEDKCMKKLPPQESVKDSAMRQEFSMERFGFAGTLPVAATLLQPNMVGIFSRLSATKSVGLFSHGSLEEKEEHCNVKDMAGLHVQHGIEPPEEFMPIEHPLEPMENDQPIRCPQPEPCIIHDGRILKERLRLSMQRCRELPFVQERETHGLQHRWHMLHTQHVTSSQNAAGGFAKCSPA
ncbi:hypothetical protein L7F22_004538 [Adiantum nelumboides]|nr:hypothetical protein [Adiantum nelumboides]